MQPELLAQGFTYDRVKRMYWKQRSECCNALCEQKMLYKDKVVTDPNFKFIESGVVTKKYERIVILRDHWWKFWVPKFTTVIDTKKVPTTTYKDVKFRYFCVDCHKQVKGKLEFKYVKS